MQNEIPLVQHRHCGERVIEFVLTLFLYAPESERREVDWFTERQADQCIWQQIIRNAELPKADQGEVRQRFWLCRCPSCGEPWP